MQCFHPVRIRDPNNETETISVPCGHCFACQSNRRKDWHMRIKYELLHNVCSYTVTLTYDNEHLPKPVLFGEADILHTGYKELDDAAFEEHMDTIGFYYHPYDVRDVQLFFKRLRKNGLKFRYFGVAEYGGKRARPHYHIIFFFDYYISKVKFQTLVVNQWPCGHEIVVDETDDACIGYTLKYCLKFYNVRQPQPKIFLSKRPFIGNGYFTSSTVEYLRLHPGDVVPTIVGRLRLPRLFREKLYDDDMKASNHDLLMLSMSKMEFEESKKASELGISLEEYRSRLRQSFTNRCIQSIKKKSL